MTVVLYIVTNWVTVASCRRVFVEVVDIEVALAVAAQAQWLSLVTAAKSGPPSDRLLGAFAGGPVTVVRVEVVVVFGVTVRVVVALSVAVRFAVIAVHSQF